MSKRKLPATPTDLLNDAIGRARDVVGGDLSAAEIARRADITQSTLSRAMNHSCNHHTLCRVLGALDKITGGRVRLRLGLVEE